MRKNNKSHFGEMLVKLIKDAEMTQSEFYTKLGIRKPYFYDIISGKSNPPPGNLQFEMIKILNLDTKEISDFFSLAAKERNELPADIIKYLGENEIESIRKTKKYRDLIRGSINGEKGDKNGFMG